MKLRRRVIGFIVLCSMLISIISMPNIQVQAASFNDINASNVFLKQPVGSVTCTLVANAMMLRRTAMLRGDSDWASITANSMESTAWIEGSGLRRNYTYKSITVSHAYFNAGDKEQQLKDILAQHPEGIVLYDEDMPHAVLVTDYTDGAFYYADPSPYEGNGRMKMTSGSSVTVSSAERYWYVTSPKVYVDNTIAATGVSINKTSATLTSKGATVSLTATVSPSNATNKSVTWKSSNTSVATVDSNGKVTAVGNGTATITVTTNSGGKTATCNVTVAIPTLNSDGWYYTTVLPSDVTSTKYDIQYQNVYEKYATTSPGTGWKDTGVDKKEYTKSGSAYEADWPLQTSDTVQLVEYYYYHYCGPNTAWNDVNYYARDGYVHRDEMHLNKFTVYEYESGADSENSSITWYRLKWGDANGYDAYCHRYATDGTCDGSGGEHGERSPYWYKKYVYQNYTVQLLNQYKKTSNWGTSKDSSAAAVNIRYRLKPTSVSLNKTTATLTSKGATVSLTATIAPTDAGCKNVTWKSSNTAVATVSSTGVVTAVGNGTATITVTTESGGKTATCKVTVSIAPTGVTLNKSNVILTARGQTETLTATVSPNNAADKSVTWKSSNTDVATVDNSGKVTAVGNGIATITVTTASGSKTANCDVTVRIAVTDLSLDKVSVTLEKKGDTIRLNTIVSPYNAANQRVVWSSSDTTVATVENNGKVIAVGYGRAVITATTTDGTDLKASCEIIVKKQYEDGINRYTDGKLYYFKNNEIDTSYNGVADYENVTWYVANGKVDTSVNGLTNAGGTWYLFKDGKVNHITTVEAYAGSLWYVENGEIDFNKNGLHQVGNWYYFKNGAVDNKFTGLINSPVGWLYIEKGQFNSSYDGVADYAGSIWYIKNGQIDFSKNGLQKCGDAWYYFKNGAVDSKFTGLTNSPYGWWYIEEGKLEFDYTNLVHHGDSWWYVQDSNITFKYDGVADYAGSTWYIEDSRLVLGKNGLLKWGDSWYYFKNSAVDTNVKGLINSPEGWIYMEEGRFDATYDGVTDYDGFTWYIEDGRLVPGKNGLQKCGNEWYYFKNSTVDYNFTGLTNSPYGWWYIENGKLEFDYTNLVHYGDSWWYVEDSNITFQYDGVVDYAGSTWYVEDSRLIQGKNGLQKCGSEWYYFKNSIVDNKYTGLTNSPYGWWYIENGKLEFDYTNLVYHGDSWWYVQNSNITFNYDGIVSYDGAMWYIQDSRIDTSFSGMYEFEGKTYKVLNGRVASVD